MHWFWRATIAVVIAILLTNMFVLVMNVWGGLAFLETWDVWFGVQGSLIGTLLHGFSAVVCIAAYLYLSYRFPRKNETDAETRCRKCGYILRGISEPRCSECGERI